MRRLSSILLLSVVLCWSMFSGAFASERTYRYYSEGRVYHGRPVYRSYGRVVYHPTPYRYYRTYRPVRYYYTPPPVYYYYPPPVYRIGFDYYWY